MEVDLLKTYPKAKRKIQERGENKTEEDRAIARQFGVEFFDGQREHGYGGYHYHPRFWSPVVPIIQKHFNLNSDSKILDVGCAKGFMLFDFQKLIPGIDVCGIDISEYAISEAIEEVKPKVQLGNALNLDFPDNSFDIVISINTIHNLERKDCAKALREIQRVARKGSFITVDAYRNDDEKDLMMAWNLTAKTIMHVDEWKKFFDENGYTGDYYWFMP